MKRITTIVKSSNFFSSKVYGHDFDLVLIIKYCPDDICDRGLINGQNFYISSLQISGTHELPLGQINYEVDSFISNLTTKQSLDFLITALNNPHKEYLFIQEEAEAHIEQLTSCLNDPKVI